MRDRWEILANYKMQRVPQNQIAEVLGVSEGLVSQEVNSEEFQKYYAEHLLKHARDQNEYDDGWDALEKIAIGSLLETLQYVHDPRFKLQVAMVANKAQRRVSRFNHPLDAQRAGAPVVVQLRSTFIEKMQVNVGGGGSATGAADTADTQTRATMLTGARTMNIPSPKRIENLFTQQMVGPTLQEEADELLAEVVNR